MANNYTKVELDELICEVMGLKSITPTIRKQVNTYVLVDHMTYKEIARCIVYYQEVKKKKLEPLYGIFFVPAIKEEAAKYFIELERQKKVQKEQAQKVAEFKENNIIFNIGSLEHKKRKPKQLDVNEINIEGESDDD